MPTWTLNVIKAFMEGAIDGLNKFIANFGKHFVNALAAWLGLPPEVFQFDFKNARITDYLGLIAKLLGLDYAGLLAIAAEVFGSEAVAIAVKVISEVIQASQDAAAWVQAKVKALWEYITGLVADLINIVKAILEEGIKVALTLVVQKAIQMILAYLTPAGGVAGASGTRQGGQGEGLHRSGIAHRRTQVCGRGWSRMRSPGRALQRGALPCTGLTGRETNRGRCWHSRNEDVDLQRNLLRRDRRGFASCSSPGHAVSRELRDLRRDGTD